MYKQPDWIPFTIDYTFQGSTIIVSVFSPHEWTEVINQVAKLRDVTDTVARIILLNHAASCEVDGRMTNSLDGSIPTFTNKSIGRWLQINLATWAMNNEMSL